jgi:DNA-binding NtrC family response regulator
MLIDYPWPGNVRELRNVLERAAILCDGGLITGEYLALTTPNPLITHVPAPAVMAAGASAGAPLAASAPPTPLSPSSPMDNAPLRPSSAGDLQSIEKTMIAEALQAARFNKSKAAKALGLTRHQLYLRLQKYGLE